MKILEENTVFKELAYIGGAFCKPESSKRFSVLNPYNGELLANVADCGEAEAEKAVRAAHVAFQKWKDTTGAERAAFLRRWYDLILKHKEELACLLTLEQGKPIKESRNEIAYGASFVEWFAEEAKRTYGDIIPAADHRKRMLVLKQPVGVVAAITPWNFPNAMITRKVAPALAAGCTVVLKPASKTPLSALALAALAQKAGIPDGVFNVVPGSNASILGKILSSHYLVKKVSFTGSTRVGKLLLGYGAHTVKKMSMELGGNAPFIVFDDADLDRAVEGLMASKFRNAGQTCVCTNRIFVQEGVYESFISKLKSAMQALRVGNGMLEETEIGPLIDEKAVEFSEQLVTDALKKGGTLVLGGERAGKLHFLPTLVKDADPGMQLFHEEIFGPVAAVYLFKSEKEVVEMANDTIYGLASYFYGSDQARIWRVAEALDYGMVGVNTGSVSAAEAPFGGINQSGYGREGSKYGMEDYQIIKYLNWDVSAGVEKLN